MIHPVRLRDISHGLVSPLCLTELSILEAFKSGTEGLRWEFKGPSLGFVCGRSRFDPWHHLVPPALLRGTPSTKPAPPPKNKMEQTKEWI